MATEADTTLHVPAQDVPMPTTISREAQQFLAGAAKRIAATRGRRNDDLGAAVDAALAMIRPRIAGFKGEVRSIALGDGASLYRVIPEGRTGRRAEVAYFDIHGGGFVSGGGEMCRLLAQLRSLDFGVEIWSVDYRLAQQVPYPAALDDCMAGWKEILKVHKPADIVLGGGSAGGNLAAAVTLRAEAEGLPLPGGLILGTPVVDFTGAGDTRQTNRYLDLVLYGGTGRELDLYLGKADPREPFVSPIFGQIGKDWPPTLLSSGTRDVLLSDAVRMHRLLRRAGVRAELHVMEAGPHGGFMSMAPEDREIMAEFRRFCEEIWGLAPALRCA